MNLNDPKLHEHLVSMSEKITALVDGHEANATFEELQRINRKLVHGSLLYMQRLDQLNQASKKA